MSTETWSISTRTFTDVDVAAVPAGAMPVLDVEAGAQSSTSAKSGSSLGVDGGLG